MKRRYVSFVRRLVPASLLCALLLYPCMATASNKANDLRIMRSADGRTKLSVQLERFPHYKLHSAKGNEVILSLYDTASSPALGGRITEHQKYITFSQGADSSIILTIPLEKAPREAEISWLAQERVLYLEIVQVQETEAEAKEKAYAKPASLNGLRFGIKDDLTRMAADLSRRPFWEMEYEEGKNLRLTLSAITEDLKRERYGPLRRLKSVAVNRTGQDASILTIEPESHLDHLKMFWSGTASKWVVDFFDLPVKDIDKALRFTGAPADKETAQSPQAVAVKEPEKTEIREDQKIPENPAPLENVTSSVSGTMVRMKVTREDEFKAEGTLQKPLVQPEAEMPSVEKNLFERQKVGGLSSEEAFLFGRIQEAMELKDYDKSTALTEQFLKKFPDSSLNENLLFMACDAQFGFLEGGNKAIASDVIKGYQEAVTRFPKSKRVPGALIKLAQSHGIAGNSYEAIGNLTLAINQYRDGDHLPEALLLRGKIYMGMNYVEKAIEDFKTVLKGYPVSSFAARASYGIATYFHGVGMYEEAEKQLKGIGDTTPGFYLVQPEYLFLRARNFFYQKNFDMARDYYFRALNLGHQPESADLLISHIGDTFHHQARERDAVKFYEMAIANYPDSEGASIAKLRLGGYSSGVSAFEEVHEKNINKPVGDLALLELAAKFYEKGQNSLAMDTLKKLLAKPNQSDIQREGRLLFTKACEKEMKRLFEANEYEKLINLYQSEQKNLMGNIDPESMLLVGESFYGLKRYPEAVQLFSQIRPLDLGQAAKGRYLLAFANIHITQGDEESAEGVLKKTPRDRLSPIDQQRVAMLMADIYQKKGDLKSSYDLYRSLLEDKRLLSDAEMAAVYLSMGRISNRENRYERARESLNRCIALAEKDKNSRDLLISAFVEMGNSYHLEGRHPEAIKSYQQGFDLDYGPDKSGYWETRYRLAMSYLGTGESVTAERLMNEISEEGDPLIQQKVQIKLGVMGLEKQIKKLPLDRKAERDAL